MEERRKINRVEYNAKSVIVVCETGEKYFVDVENVSRWEWESRCLRIHRIWSERILSSWRNA